MKRKGFSHVVKQTQEVFSLLLRVPRKISKIRYSETKPRRRELVLGIPRMPTHKAHAQTPAYQSVKKYEVQKDTSQSNLR